VFDKFAIFKYDYKVKIKEGIMQNKFVVIDGNVGLVRDSIFVSGWDETNELIQKYGITHYLLTLIKEE
jgi:hypothetical protein